MVLAAGAKKGFAYTIFAGARLLVRVGRTAGSVHGWRHGQHQQHAECADIFQTPYLFSDDLHKCSKGYFTMTGKHS